MSDDPFPLYRYTKVDKYLIEAIVDQSLYFSSPQKLNDPFDCHIDLKKSFEQAFTVTKDVQRKHLLKTYLDHDSFFSNWQKQIDRSGVRAFSQTPNEPLLWAHYADEYRGVCLEYTFHGKTDFAEDGNGDFSVAVMDYVKYTESTSPLLNLLLNTSIENIIESIRNPDGDQLKPGEHSFAKQLLKTYLFTKSKSWQYEKEWRFVRMEHGPYKPKIDRPLITKICFGLRTPPEDIALITKLAKDYSAGVTFTRMVHNETEFGFTEEPL